MQLLKHESIRVVFSCCSMEIPVNSGYELSPSRSLSHRWMILCSGNTSVGMRRGEEKPSDLMRCDEKS